MKIENKIILLSFGLGVAIWIADAAMDYFLFYKGTFTELLITDVPSHEIYIRLVILLCFVAFGFICSRLIASQRKTAQELTEALAFQQKLLDAIPVPIFYKNADLIYLGCNKSFADFLGLDREEIMGKSVYDLAPEAIAKVYNEKDLELINNPGVQIYEFAAKNKTTGSDHQVIFHKATFEKADGQVAGLIGAMLDITARKTAENEKEKLITELREALDKVKLLSGFLPICAACKKIRDDQGYWKQIETYIRENSEAEFSHSICPDCAKELYPEFIKNRSEKNPA